MPAPIVPSTPPAIASAPSGSPASAADAGAEPVSFDTVLAAALAEPAVAPADPVAVIGTEQDALQSEDGAADSVQSGELLAQALDIAVTVPVPLQAAMQPPVTSAPAVPLEIDALAAAKPGRAPPACGPARDPDSCGGPAHPSAGRSRCATGGPGKNCRAGGCRELSIRPPTRLAPSRQLLSPPPNPDSTLLHAPSADAAVSVVPAASEQAQTSARPPVQPVRLEVAAPVGSREFGARSGEPAGVDGYEPPPGGRAANRPASARTGRGSHVHRQRPGEPVDQFTACGSTRRHPGELAASAGHAAGTGDQPRQRLGRRGRVRPGEPWTTRALHRAGAMASMHCPARRIRCQAAAAAILPLRAGIGVIDVYA